MNLSEFVAATLKQIAEGVQAAQGAVNAAGGTVNPPSSTPTFDSGDIQLAISSGQRLTSVSFDVALTVVEESDSKAGIGIATGIVGLGGSKVSKASETSVSRVQFNVPVLLPRGDE
jgi:hypothetical protein